MSLDSGVEIKVFHIVAVELIFLLMLCTFYETGRNRIQTSAVIILCICHRLNLSLIGLQ